MTHRALCARGVTILCLSTSRFWCRNDFFVFDVFTLPGNFGLFVLMISFIAIPLSPDRTIESGCVRFVGFANGRALREVADWLFRFWDSYVCETCPSWESACLWDFTQPWDSSVLGFIHPWASPVTGTHLLLRFALFSGFIRPWDSSVLGFICSWDSLCFWNSSALEVRLSLGFIPPLGFACFGIHSPPDLPILGNSPAAGFRLSPVFSTPDAPVFGIPTAGMLNELLYITYGL